jgi:enoyl-[acyl-carrier-protein] reductase (NADH)
MSDQVDLSKIINLSIMDMLMLEPENCSVNLHIVDSDQMGIDILPNILANMPSRYVIGVSTAIIRHKIAFNLNTPISAFSFIRDNKSDLEQVVAKNSSLLLWDYLNLSQPLTKRIVYRGWDQVDIIVILRNIGMLADRSDLSLHHLVVAGN